MAVRIRLARKGRKKLAYYHIVVADSRSPRDGRYIEKIGKYNPLTNPATIELDFDKALGWLQNGALPSETCRAILSYKGVLIKKHLLEGVKKGAFDETEATRRFEEWMKQNEAKIEAKRSGLEKSREEELDKQLTAEKKINEARAARLAKKQAALIAKAEAASKPESAPEEEAPADKAAAEEVPAEDVTADVPSAEETEPLAESVSEEAPVTDETPAEEAGQTAEATEKPAE
ncbi:MAG: 30S ribosomal protein S16 [Bacteroidales bacterium]|nr:30S ribosomal protein S16 [Bacteroidales bacterium]